MAVEPATRRRSARPFLAAMLAVVAMAVILAPLGCGEDRAHAPAHADQNGDPAQLPKDLAMPVPKPAPEPAPPGGLAPAPEPAPAAAHAPEPDPRSEEHTSELQ